MTLQRSTEALCNGSETLLQLVNTLCLMQRSLAFAVFPQGFMLESCPLPMVCHQVLLSSLLLLNFTLIL